MARELRPINISEMPELLRLAAEMAASKQPLVLQRDGEDMAVVTPISKRKRSTRVRPVTKDDLLWGLIGIGRSDGPTDVSSNKHKYLAEAYQTKTE